MVVDEQGEVVAALKEFEEDVVTCEIQHAKCKVQNAKVPKQSANSIKYRKHGSTRGVQHTEVHIPKIQKH